MTERSIIEDVKDIENSNETIDLSISKKTKRYLKKLDRIFKRSAWIVKMERRKW